MSEHLITYGDIDYSLGENNMIEAYDISLDSFLFAVEPEDLIHVCQLAANRIIERYSEESRSEVK